MKKTILSLLVAVGLIGSASASVLTGDLTNGLVAYYSLNGNLNDSSASDIDNLNLVYSQLIPLSAGTQSNIDDINAAIASYSLLSLEQSFSNYNYAVGKLETDFTGFSYALNFYERGFLNSITNILNQIFVSHWDSLDNFIVIVNQVGSTRKDFLNKFDQAKTSLVNTRSNYQVSLQDYYASVPEPSTYALFGIGVVGMLMVMRRKKTA